MRGFLLWCTFALAVVARAEEEQVAQENVIATLEDEDVVARIDVQRMLGDLFTFTDEDDAAHDSELGINRDDRAMSESEVESRAVVEPEDQARYNKFMDTFYRRLNADARQTIDPLTVNLADKKSRKNKTKGKKDATKGEDKKKVNGEKDESKKGTKKKGGAKKDDADKKKNKKTQKKGNNKNNKNNKKTKKSARNPKFMNLEGVEDETAAEEEVAIAEEEEEVHLIVKRDAEDEDEIEEDEVEHVLERQERSVPVEEDEDDAVTDELSPVARRTPTKDNKNKGNKNKNKKNKAGRKNKKNKNKNNKNKNNKAKRSTNKSHTKKKGNSNKGNKKAKSGAQTSRASVSGIASLRRSGDVTVVNRKDGKELRSAFTIGPVELNINRKFGSGKSATVRTATASATELTGQMNLYVAANGKAKITKFTIARPAVVTTSGNLNKDENKRSGTNNFMEMSIARSTPFAAKKLKLAARDVLQATESKN